MIANIFFALFIQLQLVKSCHSICNLTAQFNHS